ncbi:MAG: cytochrome c4 [Gallionella sp.]|nr:cytochrome c4 [Gallionella sp.]
MKIKILICLFLSVFFGTPISYAENEVLIDMESEEAIKLRTGEGDPVVGETKAQLCVGCHGDKGNSTEPLIPKLSGQFSQYIAKELRNYQAGVRTHQIMNAMSATVSDENLADITAYFAHQKKMAGNHSSNNQIGKRLFIKGDASRAVIGCINCHGSNGKGRLPATSMFPVIGGQHKDYLRNQIMSFRNQERTNSASGVMNNITKLLTDEEIDALADYISVQ